MNEIVNFLELQSSFEFKINEDTFELVQLEDLKKLVINYEKIEKVIKRKDVDGADFLQINYCNSELKVLITKSLIGFKPVELNGLTIEKMPRVVTTIDLKSVKMGIEDIFSSEETQDSLAEIQILKKIYKSILRGAEQVGFNMCAEKHWLSGILNSNLAFTA